MAIPCGIDSGKMGMYKENTMATYRTKMQAAMIFWLLVILLSSAQQRRQGGVKVGIWLTDGRIQLNQQGDVYFGRDTAESTFPTLDISDQRMQKIRGFGAAMTDTSAWLISTSPQREKIMRAFFDPRRGSGISFLAWDLQGAGWIS